MIWESIIFVVLKFFASVPCTMKDIRTIINKFSQPVIYCNFLPVLIVRVWFSKTLVLFIISSLSGLSVFLWSAKCHIRTLIFFCAFIPAMHCGFPFVLNIMTWLFFFIYAYLIINQSSIFHIICKFLSVSSTLLVQFNPSSAYKTVISAQVYTQWVSYLIYLLSNLWPTVRIIMVSFI